MVIILETINLFATFLFFFIVRSNLAALIPSNHYASVAASNDFQQRRRYERRRNRAYSNPDENDTNKITQKIINSKKLSATNCDVVYVSSIPTVTTINPSIFTHNYHNKQNKLNSTLKDHSFSSLSYHHRNGQWIPCDLSVGYDFQSTNNHGLQLSWRKKVYEFFSAPVTRFYLHVVSLNYLCACFIFHIIFL